VGGGVAGKKKAGLSAGLKRALRGYLHTKKNEGILRYPRKIHEIIIEFVGLQTQESTALKTDYNLLVERCTIFKKDYDLLLAGNRQLLKVASY
jgi:hypothetical protein